MLVSRKINQIGLILSVFIVLTGTGLWLTGNLHFGPEHVTEAAHIAHDAEKSAQVTVWTERFEIFLEHPLIVANTRTKFVTHISDLLTLEPRKTGPVTFILRRGSQTPIKHLEPAPARDGIYIPELTFPGAGEWNVALLVPHGGKDYVIALPPFEVYRSHAQIDNAPAPKQIDGISFLKEQQWKISTKTEPVRWRQIADARTLAVPESAIVDEGTDRVAFVQLAGETFEERRLKLGPRADGFVQVLAGLSEGERVVTKGAAAVAQAEHEADEHEQVVNLADEDIERFGIEVGAAGPGNIDVHVRLPGQIAINTDRMAHIVPNAPGVVRLVVKNVGDTVNAGEVLAWIESTELGTAKVDYLTKLAEVGCCSMDLTRTQQVHDSTMKLLETLQSAPPLETLNQISGAALDKNHTTLVSSYAELVLAKSAYQREKSLFEKNISSKQDYLAAENEFKKAEAIYAASRDSITFEVRKNLIDAQRDQQVRLIGLKGAERSLYVLGLTAEDINDISLLGQAPSATSAQEEVCTDPNCTECAKPSFQDGKPAMAKSSDENEKLAWYPLRAPFDATVIDKHITLGEKLSGDSDAFTVADMSSVWINLNIHQKDLALVKPGQHVRIAVGAPVPNLEGTISYLSPVVGQSSRTTLARVVLDNTSGLLRPGTFVTADVLVDKVPAKVAVAKDTLQHLDDETTIFVRTDHGFEPRTVTLGRSNDAFVEITSGLEPGEKIVTKNSFRLKAELENVAGGGHAGHAH